ncbi:hypothetical protein JOB18_020842 [Solea senegalensis]|uniref:Uncharacterized protein n=1 Tax=Solea senegalensis TaxID=28829 RepID=A0AAV6Q4D9_SOLSE|nr:hypothetical protein JOB18_020842 [Solea senegalensis]
MPVTLINPPHPRCQSESLAEECAETREREQLPEAQTPHTTRGKRKPLEWICLQTQCISQSQEKLKVKAAGARSLQKQFACEVNVTTSRNCKRKARRGRRKRDFNTRLIYTASAASRISTTSRLCDVQRTKKAPEVD